MSTTTDSWDPGQYERFREERGAPFFDLLRLVRPRPGARVVDLGCGTGEWTVALHRATGAAETIGVDNSAAMLERAAAVTAPGLRFEAGDLREVSPEPGFDVVFSNAALQWVPDHANVLATWTKALRPEGQLAVQVPANVDHPSHLTAAEVATEEPFLSAFDGVPPPDPVRSVQPPEVYAELLESLGYAEQHVRLQVYGHRLASTSEVVEWVKGTSLTRFRRRLPDDLFDQFLARYRERLVARLGDRRPYFYAFKRILFCASR